MRILFAKLIREYAQENELPCTVIDGDTYAELSISGLPLQFGLIETPGMLLIQAPAGVLPREGKETFYETLLDANNLFSGTHGLTFGIDEKSELVTMQLAWPMDGLTGETFNLLMLNLLQALGDWLGRIDAADMVVAKGEDDLDMMNLNGAIHV